MIPLFKHFVSPDAVLAVAQTMQSSCIGQGPKVDEFEKALEPWIGPNVTVNSGTSALWLAYDLAGIKPGDYVIATPMTCLLGLMPLTHMQANILWADVYPDTGLIDPNSVHKLLHSHPQTVAIYCVDYAGALCDLGSLVDLAEEYGAVVIDDAAHSFGENRGNVAHMTAYSYQSIKMLTCVDGGSLVVNGAKLRQEAILKRWCGLDRTSGGFRCEQIVTLKSYKFHLSDVLASIGLANLPHVKENMRLHRSHAEAYDNAGLGKTPKTSNCWMYNVAAPNRESFVRKMAEKGIQCARTHNRTDRHPIFTGAISYGLPGVDEYNAHQTSIPCGWWLKDEDVVHIIKSAWESL